MIKWENAKVGQKVKYVGPWDKVKGVKGTITALYPRHSDDHPAYIGWASVKVENLPDTWPYQNTNLFAPSLNELEVVDA